MNLGSSVAGETYFGKKEAMQVDGSDVRTPSCDAGPAPFAAEGFRSHDVQERSLRPDVLSVDYLAGRGLPYSDSYRCKGAGPNPVPHRFHNAILDPFSGAGRMERLT